MSPFLKEFCDLYSNFLGFDEKKLRHLYASSVRFSDPLHDIVGLEEMLVYFRASSKNLTHCRFEFDDVIESEQASAALIWQMHYAHPKLNRGEMIALPGASYLKIKDEKIVSHRDYYDMGAMLYERVPLLGSAISWLKKSL